MKLKKIQIKLLKNNKKNNIKIKEINKKMKILCYYLSYFKRVFRIV